MSTPNDNKRQLLISKLKEMFQMNQACLDFGIYLSGVRSSHGHGASTSTASYDILTSVSKKG